MGKIAQIISAVNWWAVYVTAESEVHVGPLACWALIADQNILEGMVTDGRHVISVRECPNFAGYVYALTEEEAKKRAEREHRPVPLGSLPPEKF